MGSQTMASTKTGGAATQRERGQTQSLGRQGSLYSLTLDEVQSHLGEPLHSMNLDELLRSVFPDGVTAATATTSQQREQSSGLFQQGSIAMPPELSRKAVDEVWKGIQSQAAPKRRNNAETGGRRRRERQPTLGEVTLEDFLVKAGVVTQGSLKEMSDDADAAGNVDPVGRGVAVAGASDLASGAQWIEQYKQQIAATDVHQQHGHQSVQGVYMTNRLVPQPLNVGPGAVLESSYSDGQASSGMIGGISDSQTPGRKRGMFSGDVADKLMERRQKRMIKNRESAARSRARKQAYTNELENKVSRLEEENVRLKRQKELDEILCAVPVPEPKYQLRRTSSADF